MVNLVIHNMLNIYKSNNSLFFLDYNWITRITIILFNIKINCNPCNPCKKHIINLILTTLDTNCPFFWITCVNHRIKLIFNKLSLSRFQGLQGLHLFRYTQAQLRKQ